MSNPSEPDASSVYDADLSSDAESNEIAKNIPKKFILRRKDSTYIEAVSTYSRPSDLALQAQLPAGIHLNEPSLEIKRPENPRRYGKADWRPDVSSALFSASGQQDGLGECQRGYLSSTYVTHLNYPDTVTEQQREPRMLEFLRHFKCWQQQGG